MRVQRYCHAAQNAEWHECVAIRPIESLTLRGGSCALCRIVARTTGPGEGAVLFVIAESKSEAVERLLSVTQLVSLEMLVTDSAVEE